MSLPSTSTPLLGESTTNGIVSLTLQRPERKNALTRELVVQLGAALERVGQDRSVRVIVLCGSGGAFCSGADLSTIRTPEGSSVPDRIREFHALIRGITGAPKPVIASVDGPAVGFGADLALACDLRVMTDRAYMEESFTRVGLMPDGGGTYFLPQFLGPRAFEAIALAERLCAAECKALGIANQVVTPDDLATATQTLAEALAAAPPLALAEIKAALHRGRSAALEQALAGEAAGQERLLQSADFEEGVNAFLEKRPARFCGR